MLFVSLFLGRLSNKSRSTCYFSRSSLSHTALLPLLVNSALLFREHSQTSPLLREAKPIARTVCVGDIAHHSRRNDSGALEQGFRGRHPHPARGALR